MSERSLEFKFRPRHEAGTRTYDPTRTRQTWKSEYEQGPSARSAVKYSNGNKSPGPHPSWELALVRPLARAYTHIPSPLRSGGRVTELAKKMEDGAALEPWTWEPLPLMDLGSGYYTRQ